MRILISGASGFVGAPLSSYLIAQGHEVKALAHSRRPDTIFWDPEKEIADIDSFQGFDAVIHLAGEPLSFSRWSESKKEKILKSRVDGTLFLASLLCKSGKPPKIFISASAVGFYGDRGEELLDESKSGGSGFLANVCEKWEKASRIMEDCGARTVNTRFGIVLGNGGVLRKILPLYRWGLGAVLGNGRTWMSWISLNDLIRAMGHLLSSDLKGAVNFVSPQPVRQEIFSHTLARLLSRPCLLKAPAPILRFFLGDMANGMLLSSANVLPVKLLNSGFSFENPTLEETLQKVIESVYPDQKV